MADPAWTGSSSSVGHSFRGPRLVLRTSPRKHSASSARSLPPRRGRPCKRGRASARSGQWGPELGAGAERPQRDAPSGGCFKMADAAGPSRPGAAAFWTWDCILCPPGRGRWRPLRCGEWREGAWGLSEG